MSSFTLYKVVCSTLKIHTYSVYSDSIPSLCLFSSVAPCAYSRRSVEVACIIRNVAISIMPSYLILHVACSTDFMRKQSFNSSIYLTIAIHFISCL